LREAKEHVQGSRFKVQGAEKDVQGSRLKVQGPKKHYELNKRQLKELEFYWQDYQIDLQCQIPSTKFQAPNKFQNSSSKKKNVSEFQSLAPPSSASLRFRVSEDNDTLNLEP
jgi:hypothetical protein